MKIRLKNWVNIHTYAYIFKYLNKSCLFFMPKSQTVASCSPGFSTGTIPKDLIGQLPVSIRYFLHANLRKILT